MKGYKEVKGDLIKLALEGNFDVIVHGVNCFCKMGAGIAPQMAKAFECDKFDKELEHPGNIDKLGTIDYKHFFTGPEHLLNKGVKWIDATEVPDLTVVNAYTQYKYGRNHADGVQTPIDYEALTLCMRKINHRFAGKHIGLPGLIGCGLAGGNPEIVKAIIKKELKDCDVTIVYLK